MYRSHVLDIWHLFSSTLEPASTHILRELVQIDYKTRFHDYICTAAFLRKFKVEASVEHDSQSVTLSSQIVRAKNLEENRSLKLLVPIEVLLQ